MQPADYYITMELLSRQMNILTRPQKSEVSDMAFISALFYGPGFLKSSVGSRASFNDLTSMKHFQQLRVYMRPAAEEALRTWNRHLDFLTPQHIVASLVNDDFSDAEREGLARALLDLLPARNPHLPPTRVTYPGPDFSTNPAFWPADGSLPSLRQFVTLDSFLIFNIMDFEDDELQSWWESPIAEWNDDEGSQHPYNKLKLFVKMLHYTNDAAERLVFMFLFLKSLFLKRF